MQIMATASFEFLAFAFVAATIYNLSSSLVWRQAVLLIADVYFLYTFIGNLQSLLPFLGFVALGYVGVRTAQGKVGTWAYVPMLILVIGLFVWLKRYAV